VKQPTHLLWPLLAALLALAVTGGLWRHERQTQERHLRDNFDFGLRQTATRIEQRLASYEQMLRGARGLFESSDSVTPSDFSAYVDILLGGADFSGVRSFAYAAASASAPASALVTLAAPAGARALGEDPLADPERRAAMLLARDSGRASITGRLLAGDDSLFVMFMPVYANDRFASTVAERRENLRGWVMARFDIDEVMSSLYGESTPGLEVRVYDGVEPGAGTLMYPRPEAARSGAAGSTRATAAAAAPDAGAPRFDAREYIGFAGHTWTLVVHSTPAFERHFSNDSPRIILIAGIGLSALLALVTWQLVTARERAHAAARSMTRQWRESAERYRRIVETANEGIWTLDAGDRTSFVNPKLQQMLGYDATDMLGRPWREFSDADVPREPADAHAIADMGDGAGAARRTVRLRRRDGSELWATLSTGPITDADGRHAGTLAMVTDVTEHRRSEANRALLEAQLRQSQKMEAIGTLAGGIAHDFNNILAAILGNVNLAQQALAAGHAATAPLAQIGRAGERARSLVQQIVAFSRRHPQALEVQPLQPLLEETLTLLRSTLPTLVELETQFAATPLRIGADATQLQQVLMNLCTNAWHALKGGAGHIVVGLESVVLDADDVPGLAAGAHAHLWVSDDGTGMDEATRQRVFEPFFTTKPVGQGTGLGLSVVHGIVASHHGAITVRSGPGQGSTFDLYFPLAAATAPGGTPPAAATPVAPGRGEHVLYVDDDPVMGLMVESLLQRAGYRVGVLANPLDALLRLRDAGDDIDVVVSDFNMPELSGLDLAREITQLRPGLPVVITSGFVTEALLADARRVGVAHVLQKEYTLEQLAALVQAALAGRRPLSTPAQRF